MVTDTEWQPYFAWLPVTCDVYSEQERARHNGKFTFKAWGWVERYLHTWTDDDDSQTVRSAWRYREIKRK